MILIVQSQWNASVTDKIAEAAEKFFKEKKIETQHVRVPGALEIPLAIQWAWKKQSETSKPLLGAVACGCVIKGDTEHFEIVAHHSSSELVRLSSQLSLPIGHAILACYTTEQAAHRSTPQNNKGVEAAEAVFQMMELKKKWEL